MALRSDLAPMAPPGFDPAVMPGGPPMPITYHDVTVVRRTKFGRCKVEAVPPEEFGITRRAKTIRDSDYTNHTRKRTETELIDAGYDAEQVKSLPDASSDETTEETARDTVEEDVPLSDAINKATRLIDVTEHYAVLDYEGDGKARLYKVTTAGGSDSAILKMGKSRGGSSEKDDKKFGQVLKRKGELDIEPVDASPFAAITPYIVTHRFFGKSVADMVLDIMRIKTSILRGALDNIYLANNQRLEVAEEFTTAKTLDDLLSNRPGGLVRTKRPGGVLPIPNQPLGDFVYPMLEYFDATREWRTGVTRQGQGIDANALQNQTAAAVTQVFNAAQAKIKLIARIFAETGIKDLAYLIHATVRKNETAAQTVQLRNKWVTVNPREWKRRDDMRASVGLGSGSKPEQMAFWSDFMEKQGSAFQNPQLGLVTPSNIYQSMKKYLTLSGERATDAYLTDPATQPPPEEQPDPKMVEAEGKLKIKEAEVQGKQQSEQVKLQADRQAQQQKLAADMAMMRAKAQLDREQMQAEFALKEAQMQAEFVLKQRQMEMEMQLEREGMVIDAKTKVATAPVRMGGKVG